MIKLQVSEGYVQSWAILASAGQTFFGKRPVTQQLLDNSPSLSLSFLKEKGRRELSRLSCHYLSFLFLLGKERKDMAAAVNSVQTRSIERTLLGMQQLPFLFPSCFERTRKRKRNNHQMQHAVEDRSTLHAHAIWWLSFLFPTTASKVCGTRKEEI